MGAVGHGYAGILSLQKDEPLLPSHHFLGDIGGMEGKVGVDCSKNRI